MKKFYSTTPIYYVNASPHIGHAYTNIVADCLVRFKKLTGSEVFFLTGTDEHGEKVKKVALSEGKDPQEFVDSIVVNFKKLWEVLNIKHDFFIRTTDRVHKMAVQEVIKILSEKGDIYKAQYKGFYCVPCEGFWTKAQVKESKGCPECKREVEELVEENYFFKLSKYETWLKEHLKNNPDFVKPKTRYNEVIGFLANNKLEDLCISRPKKRVSWGIEFPLDTDYVVYVWFDALLNYISAIGFGQDQDKFNKWWPADVHFMAKDIIRHHAIFWPIMLKALDLKLPNLVMAHGWWKMDSQKMSKSIGNIVNPFELVESYGVDALRYFLLREIPLGADGNFSVEALISRTNSDLANDLGNLVFRVLNMADKYFNREVKNGDFAFKKYIDQSEFKGTYTEKMESLDFSQALSFIWGFISVMNKSIEDIKPWALAKEKRIDELQAFIWSLLEGIRLVSVAIWPFMPATGEAILEQLGRTLADSKNMETKFQDFKVTKKNPLFPRIDVS